MLKEKRGATSTQNARAGIVQAVPAGPQIGGIQPSLTSPVPQEQQQQQDPLPTFTPFTVAPTLKNAADVSKALRDVYPPLLRNSGIGGFVKVWFYIDEQGLVIHRIVKQSSGYPALDEAALKVAETMQFTPALNRDQPVKVWVDMPIVFRPGPTKDPEAGLTPEEKARVDEIRRLANQKMTEEANRDQAAAPQRAAVTARQGDTPVTVPSRARNAKDAATPELINTQEVSRAL